MKTTQRQIVAKIDPVPADEAAELTPNELTRKAVFSVSTSNFPAEFKILKTAS